MAKTAPDGRYLRISEREPPPTAAALTDADRALLLALEQRVAALEARRISARDRALAAPLLSALYHAEGDESFALADAAFTDPAVAAAVRNAGGAKCAGRLLCGSTALPWTACASGAWATARLALSGQSSRAENLELHDAARPVSRGDACIRRNRSR